MPPYAACTFRTDKGRCRDKSGADCDRIHKGEDMLLHIQYTLAAVVIGFLLDMLFGDPHGLYHPVQAIGKWITLSETALRKILPKNRGGERLGGICLVILVAGVSTAVPWAVLFWGYRLHWAVGLAIESFLCYQLLAARSLRDESMKVYDRLKEDDLAGGRYAVSMIVGRDTANLTEEGVTKAAVETVAENASDGVLAPLFYMMIGGAVWGFAYKSVNTMDSMVGYKNDRYRYFGTAAALLDDVMNYIPARLSAVIMTLAVFFCGMDGKRAWRIFLRDRRNHASPNSAHTEAVMAGALGIQLAGDAWYFGQLHKKQTIGDPCRPVVIADVPRANRLLMATAWLALLIFGAIRLGIMLFIQTVSPGM